MVEEVGGVFEEVGWGVFDVVRGVDVGGGLDVGCVPNDIRPININLKNNLTKHKIINNAHAY